MRKPQLDGLRFFLFLAIFIGHYFVTLVETVGYAVGAFFILSGFVVTYVLLSDREPRVWARIRNFYLRRLIRVSPLYYTVVTLLVVFVGLSYPAYYVFHALNIKLYLLSAGGDQGLFRDWLAKNWRRQSLQIWTLSVEEQFYLIYPVLLLLTPPRRRLALLLGVVVASVVTRQWLAAASSTSFYGALLPVPMEYLAWGGIFATLMSQQRLQWLPPFPAVVASAAAIVLLAFIEFHYGYRGYLLFRPSNFQTPVAAFLGVFVWGLWNLDSRHLVVRALGCRPLAYLGMMTFGMYVMHLMSWEIYRYLLGARAIPGSLPMFFGTLAITILMSIFMWHCVETPFNKLRKFVGRNPVSRPSPKEGEAVAGEANTASAG